MCKKIRMLMLWGKTMGVIIKFRNRFSYVDAGILG